MLKGAGDISKVWETGGPLLYPVPKALTEYPVPAPNDEPVRHPVSHPYPWAKQLRCQRSALPGRQPRL